MFQDPCNMLLEFSRVPTGAPNKFSGMPARSSKDVRAALLRDAVKHFCGTHNEVPGGCPETVMPGLECQKFSKKISEHIPRNPTRKVVESPFCPTVGGVGRGRGERNRNQQQVPTSLRTKPKYGQ